MAQKQDAQEQMGIQKPLISRCRSIGDGHTWNKRNLIVLFQRSKCGYIELKCSDTEDMIADGLAKPPGKFKHSKYDQDLVMCVL